MRNETIQLSPKMPPIEAFEIPWVSLARSSDRIRLMIKRVLKTNPAVSLPEV